MIKRLRLLIVAAALAFAGAACSSDAGTGGAATERDAPSENTFEYAVGERGIELVDASRPTAADPKRNLPARPNRRIAVTLLYPADGEPDSKPIPVVDAAIAEGRFPLVVFSHGWTMRGDSPAYLGRLQFWAGAGYVVAAPTFPLSSGPGGAAGDFVNQPDDVSFVIDELLTRVGAPDDPLYQHLDPEHIGVAGHSLGAFTTIGVTFNSCCRDTRIDAAVEISGVEVAFPGGDYADWPATPLLAIHGAEDRIIAVAGSDKLIDKARPPTYYLRFPHRDHVSVLSASAGVLVDETVIAFFDLYLKDDARHLAELPDRVRKSRLATFDAHYN